MDQACRVTGGIGQERAIALPAGLGALAQALPAGARRSGGAGFGPRERLLAILLLAQGGVAVAGPCCQGIAVGDGDPPPAGKEYSASV